MLASYIRATHDLKRYNPRWYEMMHVTDIATWLCSWFSTEEILGIYMEACSERKASTTLWDLAEAVKLSQAAYVALEPEVVKRIVNDKTFHDLMAAMVEDRKRFKREQKAEVERLVSTLKALLPSHLYNRDRGAS